MNLPADQNTATTTATETLPVIPDAVPRGPETEGTFEELGIGPEVLRAVADMGFLAPMKVQARTIPFVNKGRDLLVQSRTGSGKTGAFGIPIVDKVVDPTQGFVQAIILLPTRELALQVASELARLSVHRQVAIVPVYGGAPMGRQIEMLRAGGHVVCGTPGRVLDHLRRGTLKLDKVKCAVLDECDEMLSMGFQEDIEAILEHTPEKRQTLLFSATLPEGIKRLSQRFLRNHEHLKLSADFVGVHDIKHAYYTVSGGNREADLLRVLDFENPKRAIVFCNTRDETGRVAEFLRGKGKQAEAISSDLSQNDRERVMGLMRAGNLEYLVATDVAARGIDLESLSHVINYTFPDSPELYIHRTGRTGRAGKHGIAVSLIGPAEVGAFYYLKLLYKIKPEERSLPSEVEIRSRREGERIEELRASITAEPLARWRNLAKRVMSSLDGERMVAALLQVRAEKTAAVPAEPIARASVVSPMPSRADTRPRDLEPVRDPAPPRDAIARTDAATGDGRELGGGRDDGRGRDGAREPAGRDRDRGRGMGHSRSDGRRPERPRFAGERDRTSAPGVDRPRYRDEQRPERTAAPRPADAPASPAAPAPTGDFMNVWQQDTAPGAAATVPENIAASPPSPEVPSDVARLYLNLGRKDNATADEVSTLVANLGITVPLHDIDVMNTHSYLNVPPEDAQRLVDGLSGLERQGRRLICERARPRGR